jgi:hypothetical protein
MRYRLSTLMVLLALAPPSLFVAMLFAHIHLVLAVFPIAWCAFFVHTAAREREATLALGLSAAEWLVICAILMVVAALMYDSDFFYPQYRT